MFCNCYWIIFSTSNKNISGENIHTLESHFQGSKENCLLVFINFKKQNDGQI